MKTASDRAWAVFDRSTAYYCRLRGVPYDDAKCRRLWAQYAALSDNAPPNPFRVIVP